VYVCVRTMGLFERRRVLGIYAVSIIFNWIQLLVIVGLRLL